MFSLCHRLHDELFSPNPPVGSSRKYYVKKTQKLLKQIRTYSADQWVQLSFPEKSTMAWKASTLNESGLDEEQEHVVQRVMVASMAAVYFRAFQSIRNSSRSQKSSQSLCARLRTGLWQLSASGRWSLRTEALCQRLLRALVKHVAVLTEERSSFRKNLSSPHWNNFLDLLETVEYFVFHHRRDQSFGLHESDGWCSDVDLLKDVRKLTTKSVRLSKLSSMARNDAEEKMAVQIAAQSKFVSSTLTLLRNINNRALRVDSEYGDNMVRVISARPAVTVDDNEVRSALYALENSFHTHDIQR
eukprot:253748_1